ncbi:MAG: hypothetical protein AB7E47_06065 [Desulfovibrionaceae bacterium]
MTQDEDRAVPRDLADLADQADLADMPALADLAALAERLDVDLSGCADVATALLRLTPDPDMPAGADEALERLATALAQTAAKEK